MSASIAKSVEISCQSSKSFQDAIEQGIKKASETIQGMSSVWIKDQNVLLNSDGSINAYKVWMKVTFEVK